jgi:hypothetical protein
MLLLARGLLTSFHGWVQGVDKLETVLCRPAETPLGFSRVSCCLKSVQATECCRARSNKHGCVQWRYREWPDPIHMMVIGYPGAVFTVCHILVVHEP